ncbi:DNA polymerase I [Anaerotardibacter muris]|uniref:DNA polymerase I n=1 Tax=Anaerotardibacter muris TaxID=2941505 RepID=UPI002041B27B|nr:DNA polymerase I [Anaerotardibacter muris]
MTKTIAIIDGNSLMHRAFHAVPPAMTAPDGTPTNAAFGFLAMLIKFIEDLHPDAIVCAFDKGRPAFRMEALEQYKAQRPPMDDALRVQFPLIEGLLEALDIPVVAMQGWEGDDILGTISAQDEKLGYRSLLVTGDKDAYQLASDLTQIVTTKKGITDVVIYGPAEVEERYGVTPAQFTDFLGLKGDKSDNIPGVPGIGDKKAAAMLQEFDDLEGIYANLDAFKGKQLENLENHKDDAFLSRQVATIVRDAPIELDLESLSFPSFDPARVTEAFTNVRFMAHLSKVLGMLDGSAAATASAESFEANPLVFGEDAAVKLDELLADKDAEPVVLAGHDKQESLFGQAVNLVVRTVEDTLVFEGDAAEEALARLVREAHFVTYDAKKLVEIVLPNDTALKALITSEEAMGMDCFDVALAAYVLNSTYGGYSIAQLAEVYCGALMPEQESIVDDLALQAAALEKLAQITRTKLGEDDAEGVYSTIDLPLIGVLACMERTGAAIDKPTLDRIALTTQEELDKLRAQIYELAGEEFNIDSPKQLGHILFDVIGLTPLKKTQRGYSTNATVLKELAKVHELPELVLHYREYAKAKSTYIDALPRMRAQDGRIHTSFNEMVTATGRLSSSDPNLQNIPVRTDFGRKIRECFVPLEEGELFLSADYSQIELRLLAHLSGDEHLIDAFLSGEDFHAKTASRVFDVPLEEVTPTLRSRAKAVNFGIVYGQQAYGLAQTLDIPMYDAKEMIDRYFAAYQGVRAYLDRVVEEAKAKGYTETLFGRRRYITELNARNPVQRGFGERTAMNHPMQGTAADIIKIAMRQVQDELLAQGAKTKLILQVHDELDFSVPQDELADVSAMVKRIMESVADLAVPLLVDVTSGANWAQAH